MPRAKPRPHKKAFQRDVPSAVKSKNLRMFLRLIPAGKEIRLRMTGAII